MSFYQFDPSAATPVYKAQLMFHGVARFKLPRTAIGRQGDFKPKPLTISTSAAITTAYPSGGNGNYSNAPKVSIYETITDYDFELHEIKFSWYSAGVLLNPLVCHGWMQWFDSLRNATSNIPYLDQYWNGAPNSRYQNGAVVPFVLFPTQSFLHMDIYSNLSAAQVPATCVVEWVGVQRIPC